MRARVKGKQEEFSLKINNQYRKNAYRICATT